MGPLKGLKVIELAGIGPGPFCAFMLNVPSLPSKMSLATFSAAGHIFTYAALRSDDCR